MSLDFLFGGKKEAPPKRKKKIKYEDQVRIAERIADDLEDLDLVQVDFKKSVRGVLSRYKKTRVPPEVYFFLRSRKRIRLANMLVDAKLMTVPSPSREKKFWGYIGRTRLIRSTKRA